MASELVHVYRRAVDAEDEVERLTRLNERARHNAREQKAKADRYREALERIADHKHAGPELLRATAAEREADAYWDVKAVARAALDGGDQP